MSRAASTYPTQLELQILKVLWQQSPLLARDVQAALADAGKVLAKTSVITTLNTMVQKKYLTRKADGNTYLFSPKISEEQVAGRVLGDVVDRVFDGAASTVMLRLFEVADLNHDELRELRNVIDQKLKESK